MDRPDVPWGTEAILADTEVDFDGAFGNLCVKRVAIDTDEMTDFHQHQEKHELLVVEDGLVEIRFEDDYAEVEAGDTHFIEAGTPHQVQNIGGGVAELLEIGFPFDPADRTVIEDPYTE